jgi:hypothetical protein
MYGPSAPRRLQWLALPLLTLGLLPWPAPPAEAGSATTIIHVSPVDAAGDLQPSYTVAHHYSGARCQRRSATTGSAYRCFTAQAPDGVYDPCWVTQTNEHVVCLDRPWKHKVVRLAVTGGYDDSDAFRHQASPWSVQLASGRHCLFVPDSTHSINGRPVRYHCTRHVDLAGRFDRTRKQWRVRAYRDTTPHADDATYQWLGFARVVTAWFGQPSRPD